MLGSQARRAKQRFSQLLLEEDEGHVAEFACVCVDPPAELFPGEGGVGSEGGGVNELPGRLHLCTRSLVLEPDDMDVAVARLPLESWLSLDTHSEQRANSPAPSGRPSRSQEFSVVAGVVVRMRERGRDHPYVVVRKHDEGGVSLRLKLPHSPLEQLLGPLQVYLAAAKTGGQEREDMLARVADAALADAPFDPSRLHRLGETIRLSLPASLSTPLTHQPGHLAITDARVYFQPLHPAAGQPACLSHPLPLAVTAVPRRSGLLALGVEVFFLGPDLVDGSDAAAAKWAPVWPGASALFVMRSEGDAGRALEALLRAGVMGEAIPQAARRPLAAALSGEEAALRRVARAWSRGLLDTFSYLMVLNVASGRTFADLGQWPVFPWVLSDYTSECLDLEDARSYRDLSRPVGALNAVRLQRARERMAHWPLAPPGSIDGPFLWGSHYSAPGFVMYWLLRAAPGHHLKLQRGRFDAADRLFGSVAAAWASVTSTQSDVKELVPEFYLPDPSPLVNALGLDLGIAQDGRRLDDVELPPWARGSPRRFLAVLRSALEGPVASRSMHKWIDLVFGHAQRGPAAQRADNLFHPLTYGAAPSVRRQLDGMSESDRAALQAQAREFGQCPSRVFSAPHPPREVLPDRCPDPDSLMARVAPKNGGDAVAEDGDELAVVRAMARRAEDVRLKLAEVHGSRRAAHGGLGEETAQAAVRHALLACAAALLELGGAGESEEVEQWEEGSVAGTDPEPDAGGSDVEEPPREVPPAPNVWPGGQEGGPVSAQGATVRDVRRLAGAQAAGAAEALRKTAGGIGSALRGVFAGQATGSGKSAIGGLVTNLMSGGRNGPRSPGAGGRTGARSPQPPAGGARQWS
ncbi:unnamed protein product [Pedinophyceae sp. YPF-701]|nr:unnamed protein product [Pedinophyceae sp. YPF-701]